MGRLTGRDDSDDSPPPLPLNTLFERIFRLERHMVGRVPMLPGVSIATLAVPARTDRDPDREGEVQQALQRQRPAEKDADEDEQRVHAALLVD